MDIQSLPTDSTKKFFFILGVIFIAFSIFKATNVYTDFTTNKRLIDSLIVLRNDHIEAYKGASYAKKMSDSMNNIGITLGAKNLKVSRKKYLEMLRKDGVVFAEWNIKSYLDSSKNLNVKVETLGRYRDFKKRMFKEQLSVISLSFIFGCILSFIGFRSWRGEEAIRDRILSRQLDLLNLEYDQKIREYSNHN